MKSINEILSFNIDRHSVMWLSTLKNIDYLIQWAENELPFYSFEKLIKHCTKFCIHMSLIMYGKQML